MSSSAVGNRLTALGYAWAYSHHETPIFLQTLLKDILTVEYIGRKASDGSDVPPTGWYTKYTFTDSKVAAPQLRTTMVPLPPIEDVAGQNFVASTDLRKLMDCRNKINSLLAADSVIDEANGQRGEFKKLKLMLLTQHYNPQASGTSGAHQ